MLTLVSNFVGWDREFNCEESTAEGCYPLSLSLYTHTYICVFVCIYLSISITISGDCDVGIAVLIYI